MRWYIKENKRAIACENFEGHRDDVEMSGEQVSGVIGYAVNDGILKIERLVICPLFRTHPDVTQSSYKVRFDENFIGIENEQFERVEFDGTLSLFTFTQELRIKHVIYPSTTLPIFYERIEVENKTDKEISLDFEKCRRIKTSLCCKGYVYTEIIADRESFTVGARSKETVTFGIYTRFANKENELEEDSLARRYKRVNELMSACDVTTGDDVIDTMFSFAKLRAGESVFKTSAGRVHSPGGTNYYAAIWCNDQSEYSTPWFAFTGDEILNEAVKNAFDWFEPYMNDEYLPIPSSIISEATDFWNGAGDRGDASMFLYGNSRYFLTIGELPDPKRQKMLDWCAEYIVRHIGEDGIVISDTDELENRLSSGVNLNTSCLSYGALGYYAMILKKQGRISEAEKYLEIREKLKKSINEYFSENIKGYDTYAYHKGCGEIRAWTCLPIYMGITDRKEGVVSSIDENLWIEGGLASTEGEKIMWDRSTLYYIAALFRGGYTELGFKRLKEYCLTRLLGERVPYAVEAYPEYNMRHLSAESALFCRAIIDGLLLMDQGQDGAQINCVLPKKIEQILVENIFIDGKYKSFKIRDGVSTEL